MHVRTSIEKAEIAFDYLETSLDKIALLGIDPGATAHLITLLNLKILEPEKLWQDFDTDIAQGDIWIALRHYVKMIRYLPDRPRTKSDEG